MPRIEDIEGPLEDLLAPSADFDHIEVISLRGVAAGAIPSARVARLQTIDWVATPVQCPHGPGH